MCFCFYFFAGFIFKIDAYDLFSLWHCNAIDCAVFVSMAFMCNLSIKMLRKVIPTGWQSPSEHEATSLST